MSLREITVLTDIALITCIVQRGLADTIIQAAREGGAQGATVHFARGMGVRERLGILGRYLYLKASSIKSGRG